MRSIGAVTACITVAAFAFHAGADPWYYQGFEDPTTVADLTAEGWTFDGTSIVYIDPLNIRRIIGE